jgi:hypothetical protein
MISLFVELMVSYKWFQVHQNVQQLWYDYEAVLSLSYPICTRCDVPVCSGNIKICAAGEHGE